MALTSGFFNSSNHDRQYNAEQMSSIFDGVIADGVFEQIGNKLFTVPGEGLQVVVQSGRAWFNHTWTYNDANYPLNLNPADASLPRIDTVVLEVNHNVSVRTNSIKVIKGTPNSNPTAPSIASATDPVLAQHRLADVRVNAGATKIEVGDITIKVGQTETPFVTGIIKVTDISQLYAQWGEQFSSQMETWENDFTEWFEHLQTYLSEEVVTNLQLQIDKNKILSDTLTSMGLDASSNTDAAIKFLWSQINLIRYGNATLTVHLQDESGKALANMPLTGIVTPEGLPLSTDSSGNATGGIPSNMDVWVGVKGYIDLIDSGNTYNGLGGQDLGTKTITVKKAHTATIGSSGTFTFSPALSSFSYKAVGGGGGGQPADSEGRTNNVTSLSPGKGGDGGSIISGGSVPVTTYEIEITIGFGGWGISEGESGGSTIITYNQATIATAKGGAGADNGGTYGGAGGSWTPSISGSGKNGTDGNTTRAGSGGGGGYKYSSLGSGYQGPPGNGGAGGAGGGGAGGAGGSITHSSSRYAYNGKNGSVPGGGGGGGSCYVDDSETFISDGNGGTGGRGEVTLTFIYK